MYRTITESQWRDALHCARAAHDTVPTRYNRKRVKVLHSTLIDWVASCAVTHDGYPPIGARILYTALEDTGTGTYPDRCHTVHLTGVTGRTALCAITSDGRRVADSRILAVIVPDGGDE